MERTSHITADSVLDPNAREFYRRALHILNRAGIPFLVGGAYAFARYTGIERHTKDFDLFVVRENARAALDAFAADGLTVELTFPHWLGKAFEGDHFIDLIFASGNGVAAVDATWFAHGPRDDVFDIPVQLVPAEEMIWQKCFIMERERYDGADVAHLFRWQAETLDWERLLRRFGELWRVLLSHLVLFGFIYPQERSRIPLAAMRELMRRLEEELRSPARDDPRCRGTLISRAQYLIDVNGWGYTDARLEPDGNMTAEEIAHWTAAIDRTP